MNLAELAYQNAQMRLADVVAVLSLTIALVVLFMGEVTAPINKQDDGTPRGDGKR